VETFYALAVIPSGQQVLHSHIRQGFITQRVTDRLNYLGIVTLSVALTEVLAARSLAKRFRVLVFAWLVCVTTLVALFYIHARMDGLLDPSHMAIVDDGRFESLHLCYLWAATIGWLGGGLMLALAASPVESRNASAPPLAETVP